MSKGNKGINWGPRKFGMQHFAFKIKVLLVFLKFGVKLGLTPLAQQQESFLLSFGTNHDLFKTHPTTILIQIVYFRV